jgi:hypothetical protein
MVVRPGADLKRKRDGPRANFMEIGEQMKTTFTDGAIAVTAAGPGDVLVFKISGHLTVEEHLRCRKAIGAFLPEDLHFIVVDRHVDVGVMRPVVPIEPSPPTD